LLENLAACLRLLLATAETSKKAIVSWQFRHRTEHDENAVKTESAFMWLAGS
jgi:hypothetical protein